MEIVNHEQMESLKALADTNLKISEAKTLLRDLQESETEYLNEREKKALERIQKVLDESTKLVAKTRNNHEEIHKFCTEVSSYAGFLKEIHVKFQAMLADFKERDVQWNLQCTRQHEELALIRKGIEHDQKDIETGRDEIKQGNEKAEQEKALIESRQEQIKSALEVLNNKENGTNN